MATIPFLIRMQVVLAANAEGALEYQVSDSETLEIYSVFQKSTGNFDIVDIKAGSGIQHSNASSGDPLDGQFIQDVENAFNAFSQFKEPIIVNGGTKFVIKVKDTSAAANTVEFMLQGRRSF